MRLQGSAINDHLKVIIAVGSNQITEDEREDDNREVRKVIAKKRNGKT